MMPPREEPPMERRGSQWSRRAFVGGAAGLGLLAGCGRLPWQAQPPAQMPRIGILSGGPLRPDDEQAFLHGLREHGYIEDQNLVLHRRYAEGRNDRLVDLATELVRLNVQVIVALGVPAIQAAKTLTATVPIVMAVGGDPVRIGLVASLARPGGNVTGLATLSPEMGGKRLELLKDTVVGLSRVAVLWNATDPARASEVRDTLSAAEALGVEVQSLEVGSPDDFEAAFEAAVGARAGASIVMGDPLLSGYRTRIADLAAKSRLPAMYHRREFVEAGGLMAYGPSFPSMYGRAAYYVDRILNGTKPADLPVEQPMTFDFVVNMKTAQALGITFPNEIMLQVTEMIQ
jgi:putative ABC transport system substrate-binding protein